MTASQIDAVRRNSRPSERRPSAPGPATSDCAEGAPLPPVVKVNLRGIPKLVPPSVGRSLLHLGGGALRGAGGMSAPRNPPRDTQIAAGTPRRRAGAARRDARAARPRREAGQARPRRRADAPPSRSLRRDALERALAPHDPKLNDIRWLIGEALRRLHQRAQLDALRAVALDRSARPASAPAPACPPVRNRAARARQAARGRGARRPARLADRGAHRHRRAAACATAAFSRKSQRPGAPTRSRRPPAGSRSTRSAGSMGVTARRGK